jgi:DNA-binding Xre family transcriptional regulator
MQKALITTPQIRAARALLRWSANDLSNKSGVGISTIKRLEVMNGVPAINISTMVAIQKALENAGVEFIGSPDDRPGVRLK